MPPAGMCHRSMDQQDAGTTYLAPSYHFNARAVCFRSQLGARLLQRPIEPFRCWRALPIEPRERARKLAPSPVPLDGATAWQLRQAAARPAA